ncbi:diphthamide biosynthesis enzyme Dph2 [archaeon]|nr:diphthamide biosynthesis enzyme Dph2 [archaeon]
MQETYDFKEEYIVEEINRKNAKKVLIQLPEGIKKEGFRISKHIEENCECEVYISGNSCWGGCDLSLEEAKNLAVDLLIHFGHAPFIKVDFPILYIELESKLDIIDMLQKSMKDIKEKKLGLVSSIQYIHKIEEVKKFLDDNGFETIIPEKRGFSHYNGHVVGCEYNSLKLIRNNVEAFLVLGNTFHSLGAALMINDKKVYLLDERNEKIELMDELRDKVTRQRFAMIEKVKGANKIGIIVDLKPGQKNVGFAKVLKKDLKEVGKDSMILLMNEVTPDKLMNFYDIDAFIETACPRIAIEDREKYEKPLISAREARVITGKISWEKLLEEGLIGFY